MLEKSYESADAKEGNVVIEGEQVLDQIKKWNAEGRHVVFAPNHLKPQGFLSGLRRQSAIAQDYPILKRELLRRGITSAPVFRGDTDMKIGQSSVKRALYETHRRIFSAVGRFMSGGGIPLAINNKEPKIAQAGNREMFKKLKLGEDPLSLQDGNLTIFPYGNWYDVGEQQFDPDQDFPNGKFVNIENYKAWRNALKPGFARIALRAESPVVPVYIDYANDRWVIKFGEPIESTEASSEGESEQPTKRTTVDLVHQYLGSMQSLMRGDTTDKK